MSRPLAQLIIPCMIFQMSCRTSTSGLQGDRRAEFSPGDLTDFNPAHYEGPFTVAGDYDFDPAMLKQRYKGLVPSMFGSLQLKLPGGYPLISQTTGKPKYIREMHYHLGGNKIGIRPIPIVDRQGDLTSTDPDYDKNNPYWQYPVQGKMADGNAISGSEVMDALIQKELGVPVGKDSPVFALLSYIHPEIYNMKFEELADISFLKTENGMTHLAAYIGQGQTRNSPLAYHGFKWKLIEDDSPDKLTGYPANVYIVKPKWNGADPGTFTNNLLITLRLLNELNDGPKFPKDYKFDWLRTINLQETLAFYRGWLDPTWVRSPSDGRPYLEILKSDLSYHTYCAEHLTIALNVALNLPQNQQGYIDIWGQAEGTKLWQLAKSRYENRERIVVESNQYITKALGKIDGQNIPAIDPNKFKPLWKVKGIKNPATHTVMNESLAYPVETSIDLLLNMIEQYASWPDVGPAAMTAVMFGFAPELQRRTGATLQEMLALFLPFAIKAIKHDTSTIPLKTAANPEQAYDQYLTIIEKGGQVGSGVNLPGLTQLLSSLDQKAGSGTAAAIINQIMAPLKNPQMKQWVIANSGKDLNKEAWANYEKDIAPDLEKARALKMKLAVGETMEAVEKPASSGKFRTTAEKNAPAVKTIVKNVGYYNPPAVIHRVANGIHPYDTENLEIRAIATALSADELKKAAGAERQYEVGKEAATVTGNK